MGVKLGLSHSGKDIDSGVSEQGAEELHNLYPSQNIIRVINSMRMR
jgi:hypothetical protein